MSQERHLTVMRNTIKRTKSVNEKVGNTERRTTWTKASLFLITPLLMGGLLTTPALASEPAPNVIPSSVAKAEIEKKIAVKEVGEAKELLFQAPEASPLTVEGEDELKEHYVEKYMPIDGCSLTEPLPKTSDIDYVPPKPKPKPKSPAPKPVPKPANTVKTPAVQKADVVKADAPQTSVVEKKSESAVKEVKTAEKVSEPAKEEKSEINPYQGAPVAMTTDERYWLEKLVEAESANESYEGKVAVASVIANRVELKEFPNSVMGVIKAPKQFSPFMDGSIHRRTPSADTIRAVAEVFDNGNRNLPHDTGFFCTTAIAPHSWIGQNKTLLKVIGNHSFFLK